MGETAEGIERRILKPLVDAFLGWCSCHEAMLAGDAGEQEGEELLWAEFIEHMRELTEKVYPRAADSSEPESAAPAGRKAHKQEAGS